MWSLCVITQGRFPSQSVVRPWVTLGVPHMTTLDWLPTGPLETINSGTGERVEIHPNPFGVKTVAEEGDNLSRFLVVQGVPPSPFLGECPRPLGTRSTSGPSDPSSAPGVGWRVTATETSPLSFYRGHGSDIGLEPLGPRRSDHQLGRPFYFTIQNFGGSSDELSNTLVCLIYVYPHRPPYPYFLFGSFCAHMWLLSSLFFFYLGKFSPDGWLRFLSKERRRFSPTPLYFW